TTRMGPEASQRTCARNASRSIEIGDPDGSTEWYVRIAFIGAFWWSRACSLEQGVERRAGAGLPVQSPRAFERALAHRAAARLVLEQHPHRRGQGGRIAGRDEHAAALEQRRQRTGLRRDDGRAAGGGLDGG